MRHINFEMIDKKWEKEISASIDKLQNQKIEVIFEQVKKEIKSENLTRLII